MRRQGGGGWRNAGTHSRRASIRDRGVQGHGPTGIGAAPGRRLPARVDRPRVLSRYLRGCEWQERQEGEGGSARYPPGGGVAEDGGRRAVAPRRRAPRRPQHHPRGGWGFGRDSCHAPSSLSAHVLSVVERAEEGEEGEEEAKRLAPLAVRLMSARDEDDEEGGGDGEGGEEDEDEDEGEEEDGEEEEKEDEEDEGGEDQGEEDEEGGNEQEDEEEEEEEGAIGALKAMLSYRLLPSFSGKALFPRAGRLGVTSEEEANCELLFSTQHGLECAVVATRPIKAGEALLLSCTALGNDYEEESEP
ncbi:hypothetical protein T484DRAFT_1887029 [Baffinella frigidus]|nr:hypothetical protein T484DRAFT_1887029 [Cryptophyta sp. CCMP2293]